MQHRILTITIQITVVKTCADIPFIPFPPPPVINTQCGKIIDNLLCIYFSLINSKQAEN